MNSKYKATIITPFHNTDMSMFSETFKSVKNQTIGFENIEWIIVLHNCKQEYIDQVHALADGYNNIFLKELTNEAKSASSPRNYALEFVTSPYIEFLDSDDMISPQTVEKCVSEMEKHKAQIVIFRMAYLKENESVQSIITDVTLWNPLEEEIVLTGERLRCQELFSSINFCTHNRFFNAEFIRSNGIRFDESITMAEDAYFTLTCYSKAQKIVVLPQFIGHTYYVNSSSAVQSMNKPSKAVLHFSYGFKKMFDLLLNIHAYYNHFFLTILQAHIYYAFLSPDFTLDDWKTLQEDMGPYAKMVIPPPVNKFFSKEEGELIYKFVTDNLLKPKTEDDNRRYYNGEGELSRVIKSNKDTAFGKYYGFSDSMSIKEFCEKVPLGDFEEYSKLIRLGTEVGESDLLTNQKIGAYAYDFDESDEVRMVPVAEKVAKAMGQKFINEIKDEVTFLMMEAKPKGMSFNDGTYYDSIIGIMVRSGIDNYSLSFRGLDDILTSPMSLIFPSEEGKQDYLNLLMALRNEAVTQLYGANSWVIFNYLELLQKQGENLVSDIENGTLHEKESYGMRIGEEILGRNYPMPERAALIRKALQCDSVDQMLLTIWPNLKRVIARTGGNFTFYTLKLRKMLGQIKLELDDFITPYGILAETTEDENIFKLNVDDGFFEFLPMDGKNTSKTKLLTELEKDRLYELIYTNPHGLYRMQTGIYVRPCHLSVEGVLFRECMKPYTTGSQLICAGEALEHALMKGIGDNLYDYFCYYNEKEKRLDILVELYTEANQNDYQEMVEKILSEEEDYKAARSGGLNAVGLKVIDKETNLLWRDIRRDKHQAPADCFSPVHNLKDVELVPLLKMFTL